MEEHGNKPVPGEDVAVCEAQLSVEEFLRRHGADMAGCPDSQLGIIVGPRSGPSELDKDILKGLVGVATGLLAGILVRNPSWAKASATFGSALIGGALVRNLPGPTPKRIVWMSVRELMDHD